MGVIGGVGFVRSHEPHCIRGVRPVVACQRGRRMALLLPGQVVGGKYRLERPLAHGGMGSVWVARHVELGTPLALKLMSGAMGDTTAARGRFEREARASAHLRSPHVVHVFDYGVDGDAPYIAMELLTGEDLADRLKRMKRLPIEAVTRIAADLAKGLQKAHDLGIVHRDLKPRNVFLASTEEGEVLKILDFGIAKTADMAGDTKTGELMGSPHFMSPEQARAKKAVDHRSDLWSFGVILFVALAGAPPHGGETIVEVLMKVANEPAPPITAIAPDVPPAFDAFFAKALARDPDHRFASARDMAAAWVATVASLGQASQSAPWGAGTAAQPGAIAPAPPPPTAPLPAAYEMTPSQLHGPPIPPAPSFAGRSADFVALTSSATPGPMQTPIGIDRAPRPHPFANLWIALGATLAAAAAIGVAIAWITRPSPSASGAADLAGSADRSASAPSVPVPIPMPSAAPTPASPDPGGTTSTTSATATTSATSATATTSAKPPSSAGPVPTVRKKRPQLGY